MTPSPEEPERTYEARWNATTDGSPAVSIVRDPRGTPVLSLVGRPEFAAAGFGKLRADRVVAKLREVPADGDAGPAIELGGDADGAILVNRLDAMGAVEFVGQQIDGRADDLVALIRPIEATGHQRESGPALGAAVGFSSKQRLREQDDRRFRLRTKTIQLDIGLDGPRAKPLSLVCDGGVRIEEENPQPGKQPLRVVGDQLRVDRLDQRGGALLTIAGGDETRANGADPHVGLAEVQAEGLRVWVRDLHVDQAAGRAWTEGRGDARLLLPAGDARAPVGGEATLRWRGGMQFDGSRLAVSDEVFAETKGGWLNCKQMVAKLSRPIDLSGGGSLGGGAAIEVAEVECGGGVTIDYRATDEAGQRSHERARMRSLAVNRLTGAIRGVGPGSIRSVRLGGSDPLGGKAKANAGLKFLRVDFRDGIVGNYEDRAVRFVGGVESIYGPVLAWDHQLTLNSPDGVPPDAAELRCEELHVHEDPASSVRRGSELGGEFGPIELRALRNVRIDASIGEKGGSLVAEAASASFSQAADRFILEGDGQQLAKLWARPDATRPYVPASAGRLTHYLSLGRTTVDDLRGAGFQQGTNATRPVPPRR